MASLRAPAHASSFARGVAVRSQRASVAAVRPAGQRKGSVQVSAFFNFLQPKEEDEERAVAVQKSICLDCGYIAVDLNKEPFWYKCPVCGVGKNRFKPAEEAGANYSNLMAAKRAAKAAKAQAPKGQRPRDLLKQRQIEMGKEKGEKKGWF